MPLFQQLGQSVTPPALSHSSDPSAAVSLFRRFRQNVTHAALLPECHFFLLSRADCHSSGFSARVSLDWPFHIGMPLFQLFCRSVTLSSLPQWNATLPALLPECHSSGPSVEVSLVTFPTLFRRSVTPPAFPPKCHSSGPSLSPLGHFNLSRGQGRFTPGPGVIVKTRIHFNWRPSEV